MVLKISGFTTHHAFATILTILLILQHDGHSEMDITNEVKIRMKATKVENGFLIPFIDQFKEFKQDSILLNVEFIDLEKEQILQKRKGMAG